ncbi:hypothetical protein BBI17_001992 [Phytophthora kernoviae]|uniref:Uncharacterized protein n=1 Tax=Phytophthora kernoviae TaxID=325452 RepID=A0A421F2W7_9STRA|nr:hypothetical protein BBI17_001992 [Phytophthora kernoviae]
MDEYRTSIMCSCCHQCLKQARLFTKMKRKEDEVGIRQKEWLSMKEVKEIVEMERCRNPELADKKVVIKCTRNALRCTNSGCKANFWNRDVNATRNMLEQLKSGLKGKHGARRLRAFQRDCLAQKVEKLSEPDEELTSAQEEDAPKEGRLLSKSAAQTVRMMVWGGMVMTPIMHNWYNLMERVFRGTGNLVAAKKVVADMVFVAPQMPIWFYTSTGFMAGKTLKEAFDDSIEKQPMTLMANYMLWPAANTITYGRAEKSRAKSKDDDHREMIDDGALVSASTAQTMRMMIWGGVLFAPIAHTWVNFIERTVGSSGKVVVVKKMLLDMFVLAPSINTLFFTSTQMMVGKSPSQGFDFAMERLPQTLKANYMIWPPANIVNYSFVPLQYRILFINCVNIVWTTVLSTISSRPTAPALEAEKTLSVAEEEELR